MGQEVTVPHIVILGGGFGGLYAARALKHAEARVTIVDRRNFHLFQPLLYQVATAALNPSDIAAPIRSIVRRQKNATVLLGEAESIDISAKSVKLAEGETLAYDYLIIATGVELAGALTEIARHTMARNFRHFDPSSARVILIEGKERVLPPWPSDLS